MSQTNRRELSKLERMLATNEQQYRIVCKQIDAAWDTHMTDVKTKSKSGSKLIKMFYFF